MKAINILLLFFIAALFGCSKDKEVFVYPLEVSARKISFYLDNKEQISITSGNGNYEVVYPKEIRYIRPYSYGEDYLEDIDYSTEKLNVFIKSDSVFIESFFPEKDGFVVCLLIRDSRNQKKLIQVERHNPNDGSCGCSSSLIDDPSFWQD